jgi:hypothetical protein
MKVAILFSGRINNNIEQYDNYINNLVQNNSVDLFVCHSKTERKDIVNDFIELYKPKKIIENNETFIDLTHYPAVYGTRIYNVLYMFENRLTLFKTFNDYVIENNVDYDIIISTRGDIWLYNTIDFGYLKSFVDNEMLCIPNPKLDSGGINDQMAVGNYNTISVYLQLYRYFFDILKSGVILHPETILDNYLNARKQNIMRFEIHYEIKRYGNNDSEPHVSNKTW